MVLALLLSLFFLSLPAAFARKPCCFEFDLPIHASLTVPQFKFPEFKSSYESTAFLASSVSRTATISSLITGKLEIDRSFNIHFQYCEPEKGSNGVLLVLSHGVGFDKSYWDFGGVDYSYIAAATALGYATLSYDRLGVGRSEHADPYSEIQVPTQVTILTKISEMIRNGQLSERIMRPKKVVHIGHSFGSLITNGLVAARPSLSDGIVLTGFSHNVSWTPLFELCLGFELARTNNPARFRHYSTGYLTWGNEYDNQCAFYTYPFFNAAILKEAEARKAPFAIAELLSFASIPLLAPNFTGPVLMISGQSDLPFCGGECLGALDGSSSPSPFIFPEANPLTTYVQPNAGHALNLHHNSSAAYEVMFRFIQEHVN